MGNIDINEEGYFEGIQDAMDRDINICQEDINYRSQGILMQKKYVRDSHGDMDDEEFLQNKQSIDTDTLFVEHEHKRLTKLLVQKDKPYFGKVSFTYDEDGSEMPFYVGISGYDSGLENITPIYDWRAPVSSMYYDDKMGEASYEAPDGTYTGVVTEKKQFDISKGVLRQVVDVNENINDNVLIKALSENSGAKMRTVVATILKEQNQIIRDKISRTIVVDGRAGSGKTVIAMHRLAWLLYNVKSLKADNIMILSPNGIFADYISDVLPQLGEDNVPQKEFDLLMEEILFVDAEYETKLSQADFLCGKFGKNPERIENIKYKSTLEFYRAFVKYLNDYIETIEFKDFHFEKVTYTKEQITKMFRDRFSRYPIYERFEKIAYFICDQVEEEQNKEFSDSQKAKIIKTIKQEMIYQYAERNLVDVYLRFLDTLTREHSSIKEVYNHEGNICYEDILPIFFLQLYFYGCESYKNIKHILIDEMQDYGIFQYAILEKIFDCKKTILGDRFQVLMEHDNESVVDAIKEVCADKGPFKLYELKESYRSTYEITKYANAILDREEAKAEAIERHGKAVEEIEISEVDDAIDFIGEKLDFGDMDPYENVAVLCKDEEEAFMMYEALSEYREVQLLNKESTVYTGGTLIMPRFLAKGMEFDVVFVLGKDVENEIDKQSFYIACTRALHELYVLK